MTTATRPEHDVDISSKAFWDKPFDERERSFARLRAEPGPTWHPPLPADFPYTEAGFWAATTHQDIVHVSKHPELFSSAEGVAVSPMPKEPQIAMSFFLTMDPPEHTIFRKLISAAFTPRQVNRIQHQIERNAKDIVDTLVGAGEVDFVTACSSLLPMYTVSDMIGIAPADREPVRQAAETLFGAGEEAISTDQDTLTVMIAQVELLRNAAIEIAEARRRRPEEDLMTNIVQAEVDGHRLTNDQIGAFMILLSSAGNDTTKQTTSHAMLALDRNRDQRDRLLADWDTRIGPAVDEFVRWSTPVMDFSRTAVTDTEIRGSKIRAGDKVALFYCSGNRDAAVFDRPGTFDITRNPNPHLGFGGGGVHYCLGSHVAKTQLRTLFHELLTRTPNVEIGAPTWLRNTFVHGIKHLPANFPR
ncbi:cytochrome P450 [Nocardia aurantia]|uniref:Methyl-branched lipid omega-hydroxylase n=1 Tax=Nocardia aurantia TaxID=2585199 RepID=A0A7K0DUY7_9NOCA|nr:cytochrome P450 [Nocardia aurantia]MQY29192.1 Methyl-branched lipid omega-hydroxylase [Nocardia aurantia]